MAVDAAQSFEACNVSRPRGGEDITQFYDKVLASTACATQSRSPCNLQERDLRRSMCLAERICNGPHDARCNILPLKRDG